VTNHHPYYRRYVARRDPYYHASVQ
jgi:hypothetical protein